MNNKKFLNVVVFITITILFLSCIKTEKIEIGISIPGDMQITKLDEILAAPEVYNNKKVLLEGVFVKSCVSGCDFTYQEGKTPFIIFANNFKVPKIKKGQKVKVYAEIKAGKERVIISALGMEVK